MIILSKFYHPLITTTYPQPDKLGSKLAKFTFYQMSDQIQKMLKLVDPKILPCGGGLKRVFFLKLRVSMQSRSLGLIPKFPARHFRVVVSSNPQKCRIISKLVIASTLASHIYYLLFWSKSEKIAMGLCTSFEKAITFYSLDKLSYHWRLIKIEVLA